jgi:hypothetical protein
MNETNSHIFALTSFISPPDPLIRFRFRRSSYFCPNERPVRRTLRILLAKIFLGKKIKQDRKMETGTWGLTNPQGRIVEKSRLRQSRSGEAWMNQV